MNKLIKEAVLNNLYNKKYILQEKKKKKKKKKPFPDLTGDGKVTFADILKGRLGNIDEKTEPTGAQKYRARNYGAPVGSSRAKEMERAAKLYKDGNKDAAFKIRRDMEKKERSKKSFKNKQRKDTKKESFKLTRSELRKLIMETLEEVMLDGNTESYDEHDHIDEKLSDATKKSLRKKAEKRGLTPGSVYAEFRKGLAAYASSGSRKGMTPQQWAHARVNSATPSKPWAVVKKSKKKKKK